MSDDETIKRRALDISALRDEDEGTEELDRYKLLESIQRDAVVNEDTRRTQKVERVKVSNDEDQEDEEEVQDTAHFEIPDTLLHQLSDSPETDADKKPLETLEVEFEPIETGQIVADPDGTLESMKTQHRTVEFVAFVEPDGSVSIPNNLLANRTIRPGQKLRIVAQPIEE